MTVHDLIAKLVTQDPEAVVVIRGYEGGHTDVTDVNAGLAVLNVHAHDGYYGAHEFVKTPREADEMAAQSENEGREPTIVDAVLLSWEDTYAIG